MPGKHLVYLAARHTVPREYRSTGAGAAVGELAAKWVRLHELTTRTLPPLVVRVAPDPAMQDALDAAIPAFIDTDARGPRAPHSRLRPQGVER